MRIFGRKATGLVLLGLIAGIGVLGSSLGQGVEGKAQPGPLLMAGAATSNITPSIGGEIVGGFVPFPSTHIHDELLVRCLVLDNGRMRIAFAVADNVGISRYVFDAAKRMVNAETGIAVENLLMSATHTHSAVSARGKSYLRLEGELDEYQKFLARRIADGILRAVNNLEPARIGWAVGSEASQVFNRRYRMKPGVISLSPYGEKDEVRVNPGVGNPDVLEPAGPVDPEITFLSLQAKNGRPIAILANYSLHYVGGVGNGHISADYYGMFASELERLLNARNQDPPFVAMMSNGTSGNINNINVFGPVEKRKPYEKMRLVANQVAAEVFKRYQAVVYQDWVPLDAVLKDIRLKLRVPTESEVARAKEVVARPVSEKDRTPQERIYATRTLEMANYPPDIAIPIQALRVGDVGIAAIPTEVFVEIGLEIKKRSPFRPSLVISLANGAYGYLPTPEQHKLGGYETWLGTSRLEFDASTKIVSTILDLFQGLKQAGN
jgi:neutral ceramidase